MTNPDLAIVGTGYVGLTTAACLAASGRTVVAVDVDRAKIDRLSAGEVPILERGLDELVADGLASGRLRFTADYEAVATAPTVLLCLPTPLTVDADGLADLDLSYLADAARRLRTVAAPGAVVVTRSTVPVGCHRLLTAWLDRDDLTVAANPEFLREGTAVEDFLNPDRIVIGVSDDATGRRVAGIYRGIDGPVLITDPASAELIKYAANTYLATRLSFVNEMSRLCERVGADIGAVVAGLGSDHRIGDAFLTPGPGWGGSCFPKDTRGLARLARANGLELPVVEAAAASNERHLDHVAALVLDHCPEPPATARVAVWGATFKAGTDDVRDSPALALVARLTAAGVEVVLNDPAADPGAVQAPTAADPYSACAEADVLLVATEWPEFAEADLDKVADALRGTVVIDTRSVIDPGRAERAGLDLRRPGRRR